MNSPLRVSRQETSRGCANRSTTFPRTRTTKLTRLSTSCVSTACCFISTRFSLLIGPGGANLFQPKIGPKTQSLTFSPQLKTSFNSPWWLDAVSLISPSPLCVDNTMFVSCDTTTRMSCQWAGLSCCPVSKICHQQTLATPTSWVKDRRSGGSGYVAAILSAIGQSRAVFEGARSSLLRVSEDHQHW